ncbi:DUF6207 family protein [Streptomyces sp. NBC_00820]|uniref:DUF6207 family protein n=1 Tax=Streptomyces sp. NBC_00820 TaxID=2975842 RepID=UPI002ECFCE51|nr:DUF6207 family protein [Streptomyces sp. NBC_00820]
MTCPSTLPELWFMVSPASTASRSWRRNRAGAVVEVAAADDETAFAIQELLAARCAWRQRTVRPREPGKPGVQLRCFLDLHRQPDA